MIRIRRSEERGHFDHGWLDTYHTFSFADYHDPAQMHFRALRVINEDRVAPGAGFGMHGHADMEILTWVLSGRLQHRDDLGNGSVIEPGDVQIMSAGTGIRHSEFNPSKTEPVHLLQIWILPERRGLEPRYDQLRPEGSEAEGPLRLLADPKGAPGAVRIFQDVRIWSLRPADGDSIDAPTAPGRHGWLQVSGGRVAVGEQELAAGDGAASSGEPRVQVRGIERGAALWFDLA
jgi:redox-sensitive bicupin YhaK (pirin superfamily)